MTEVLSAPYHGASLFSSSPLKSSSHTNLASLKSSSIPFSDRTNIKPTYTHEEFETLSTTSTSSSAPSSPELEHATFSRHSYTATSASSLSLDTKGFLEDDDDMPFPSFEPPGPYETEETMPQPLSIIDEEPPAQPADAPKRNSEDLSLVNDDQALEPEPTRHVDYLAHEWREEDIWSSWRYIVARRKTITNSVRLENASWRTWTKAKNNLRTVSPEKLNWLKDCDVTWLYGPLQTTTKKPFNTNSSPPPSRLSHSSSFINKKPILKKKAASVAMLEKSISSHSLLKQAGALLRAQQSSPAHGRPSFKRAPPSFSLGGSTASSVVNTPAEYVSNLRTSFTVSDLPSSSESRHIHFNNEVEQVIAIESDEDDDKREEIHSVFSDEEEDEDDDCGLMMRPAPSQSKSSNRSTPRGSFSEGSKTIAPLPSTTLKYRGDTPEPDKAQELRPNSGLWSSGKILSPSPSQETLRPTRPSHNFLIDDEDEADMQWPPSGSSGIVSPYAAEDEPGPGMRRTESGMFMPYDENEEEAIVSRTLFGQALSAVYTVKDIAHVVWNVGWGK
jgi:hypothetical protein